MNYLKHKICNLKEISYCFTKSKQFKKIFHPFFFGLLAFYKIEDNCIGPYFDKKIQTECHCFNTMKISNFDLIIRFKTLEKIKDIIPWLVSVETAPTTLEQEFQDKKIQSNTIGQFFFFKNILSDITKSNCSKVSEFHFPQKFFEMFKKTDLVQEKFSSNTFSKIKFYYSVLQISYPLIRELTLPSSLKILTFRKEKNTNEIYLKELFFMLCKISLAIQIGFLKKNFKTPKRIHFIENLKDRLEYKTHIYIGLKIKTLFFRKLLEILNFF